ncbi:unnamed protein product [Owenia fusiformis]|uniref:Serine protease HTRA2, mitochondrial n=1 Tax=Owenia fusiformis TaxID=6347 RepID=A0A8J1XN11_OWEFU|nr:unnamed protein product [Owenia fusiformis]
MAPIVLMSSFSKFIRHIAVFGHQRVAQTELVKNISTSSFIRHSLSGYNRLWRRRAILTGIGLAVSGAVYNLAPSATETLKLSNVLGHLPFVCAATPVSDDDKPSKRFNYIADTVEKAIPAVVYIEIQGKHPYSGQNVQTSNGSGFIVRENGLILTNAHVVANKQVVKVKLNDGRVFDGYIQAVDPISDLATIRINADNLPVLKLGESSSLRPGEWVIAMGSPLSLSNTVTAGIVSTVHRGSKELGLNHKDMEYIQTDAVITFGNSGGPLVNLDGEAVGINTMKVTTGISFAIPADYAKKFLEKASLLEKRSESKGSWFSGKKNIVGRRYMGITMLTLTPSIIMELQQRMDGDFPDVKHGVWIHKVVIDSPAYNGGIRPGDVITKINGEDVKSAKDVYDAVKGTDQKLHITIIRNSRSSTVTVVPEDVS